MFLFILAFTFVIVLIGELEVGFLLKKLRYFCPAKEIVSQRGWEYFLPGFWASSGVFYGRREQKITP